MNIEEFPTEIKNDIEDQSLAILEDIRDDVVVIGGWAVRAHLGDRHGRFTLDIDGVTEMEKLPAMRDKLESLGFESSRTAWGVQFIRKYYPEVEVPDRIRTDIEKVQLRIEISGPKIRELRTHHYFEFSLTDYEKKEIAYHNRAMSLEVKVPRVEHMAAVKLGLPVDYKNNYDVAALLQMCDIDKVIETIRKNDDWGDMVARRLPKSMGRIRNPHRLEHAIAVNAGIDVKEHIRNLGYIGKELK